MGIFSRYVRGYTRRFRAKGWTDRQVVNVKRIGTLTDVSHDGTTQEVNWHRHMTRVDLAIDYYNTNLKVEPLGK